MRYADTPTVQSQTFVAAAPEVVWLLVSDIELMAVLSSELQEVAWLDEGEGPAVGRRFRGRNQHKRIGEWETVSRITECEPARVFAWVVQDPENPTASWRFTLQPEQDGTLLTQWARIGPGPSKLSELIAEHPEQESELVARRLRDLEAGMEKNLTQIKKTAERPPDDLAKATPQS